VQQEAEEEASCVPACREKEVPVRALIRGPSPSKAARVRLLATAAAFLLVLLAPSAAHAEGCPNEQLRVENRSTSLPDCRAYEMVTPAQKNEALINELFLGGLNPLVAADGRRVIANSVQCFADPESCTAQRSPGEGQPFAFSRAAAGWVTHPLAPPISFETASTWTANADGGTVLFSVPRVPPGLFEEDFLGRDEHGSLINVGPVGEHASRTAIGTSPVRSTGDLSHVLYETATVSSVWSFNPSLGAAVYEYVGSGSASPLMVGVSGGFENGQNHKPISTCGTELGGFTQVSSSNGPLSKDGRTVYFSVTGHTSKVNCPLTETAPAARELYARIDGELADARSVLISGPTPEACTSEECHESTTEVAAARNANFEAASADGSRAFFTDTQQLTDHASEDPNAESGASKGCTFPTNNTPGTGGCNLYESVCAQPCGSPAEEPGASNRELVDVSETSGHAKVAGGPRVQGVVGISADGSHVYFIAKGVLTGSEENQSHETAEDERDNLYVYAEGHVAFVTRLSSSDQSEWSEGGVANVTPAGRFLLFTSHRALTADATCVQGEAEAPVCPAQVYEYDAQTRGLVRVSIGERGFNDNGNGGALGEPSPSNELLHSGDARVASPRLSYDRSGPMRSDPTMSDDGAFVFFQSPVALTPGALNDVPVGEFEFAHNVYEYHEGHVSLISDGRDTTRESQVAPPVELLGSDTAGSNVFFTTFDPLVPQDSDTQRDIYDARIEGGVPAPASSPSCEGEACQAAPGAPPVFGAPSSSTFSGPGNVVTPPPSGGQGSHPTKTAAQIRAAKLARALKACHAKKNKRKRASCEKQARKLYGPLKKKK
jgi:hypothetical protein